MPFDIFGSNTASRQARETELLQAYEQIGRRKIEVEEFCASNPGEFAATIKFGRGVGQSNTLGAEYVPSSTEKEEVDEEGANDAAEFARVAHGVVLNSGLIAPVKGAAYGNKMIGNLTMPCGVCLIIGKGGTGKTPLAHHLAGLGVEEYAAVRIGEPLSGYCQSEHETALSIATAMVVHRDVVIDSIKDLLASGSNLMKSGLSRSVLTTISDWSAMANDLGCTLYIPVNPSSDDDDVYNMLIEASKSNATVTIAHRGGDKWEVSGRSGEGLPRFGGVDLTFKSNELTIDGVKAKRARAENLEGDFAVQSVVRSGDAIRRIIKPN